MVKIVLSKVKKDLDSMWTGESPICLNYTERSIESKEILRIGEKDFHKEEHTNWPTK